MQDDVPHYWSPDSRAEIEFVIQQGEDIIPIEVKAEQCVMHLPLFLSLESFGVIIQFISFLSYICWHVTQSFYASITLYFPYRSISPSDCSLHAGFKQDCLIGFSSTSCLYTSGSDIYIRAKYKCDIRKVVTHAILSGILTILSSLLMLM